MFFKHVLVFFLQVVTFSQSGGWCDLSQLPLMDNEQRLAILYPVKQSNGDNFKHIVVVEANGKLTPITSGKFEVLVLLKWDVQSNYM